eukprot:TRINITY_DN297_c0_g1_i2.p1 TRINITY_DN297_c0_g1~~TRINITY_DN297_c0_g1_i2.p1  ORF type:complete len:167 (-),score=49.53 TRINITY_DN297_c0_g1_i2:232-732(-)
MINIDGHWATEDNDNTHNKKSDDSAVSYIYGDEDSQHHKLPEYSVEHMNEQMHFEPKLPGLAELNETERRHGMDPNETSDHETSDEDLDKKHSNDTLVSLDTPDTGHSNVDMDIINTVVGGDSASHVTSQPSTSSKLTIKIYPPALQAVASRSPDGSDGDVHHYMD